MDVNALSWPPTLSISSAIWRVVRFSVPLNTMCSRKWLSPASSGVSYCEPEPTQKPTETERKCGMRSPMMRSPFFSVNRSKFILAPLYAK